MNILLREISKEDLPTINQWRGDRSLVDSLGSPYRYVNMETDEEWFRHYQNHRDREVRLAICVGDARKVVGAVYLTSIDHVSRNAEFSILIGDTRHQGKGIGSEATRMMLDHAFRNLNLHRVYLTVLESNARAREMYTKHGFKVEGVLRDAVFKNGTYVNFVLMSLLRSEFTRT